MAVSIPMRIATMLLVCLSSGCAFGQVLKPRPPADTQHHESAMTPSAMESHTSADSGPLTVPMTIGIGIPIKIALDSDVRVHSVGQRIHGRTAEPLYAFDKLLVPLGTQINGKISAIDSVPTKTRVLAASDGNFSLVR